MDEKQRRQAYNKFCMYTVNPPSFETWDKEQREIADAKAQNDAIKRHGYIERGDR